MPARIMIINGANLNLLGTREVEIYGAQSLKQIEQLCREHVDKRNQSHNNSWSLDFRHSNAEGELVDMVQQASDTCQALIINPAAYAHTSIALRDALIACQMPKAEVHLSNTYKREKFRQNSHSAAAVDGVIIGFGANGYLLAIDAVIEKFDQNTAEK